MRKFSSAILTLILVLTLGSCIVGDFFPVPDVTVNYDESIFTNHGLKLVRMEILMEGKESPLVWTPGMSPNYYDILEYSALQADLTHYIEFENGEIKSFTESVILEKNLLVEKGNVVTPGAPYFNSLEEKTLEIDPSVSYGNTLKSITIEIYGDVNTFHYQWTPGSPLKFPLYLYQEDYTVKVSREAETYKNPSVTDEEFISVEGEVLRINAGIFSNSYIYIEDSFSLQYQPLIPALPQGPGIAIPWSGNPGYRPSAQFTHQSDLIVSSLLGEAFFYKRIHEGIYEKPKKIEGLDTSQDGYTINFVGDANGDGLDDLFLLKRVVSAQDAALKDFYFLVAPAIEEGVYDFSGTPVLVMDATWFCAMAVGDIDGDKVYDIVINHQFFGGSTPTLLGCFWGLGDGTFSPQKPVFYDTTFSSNVLTIGDMNGDGLQDIVLGADDDTSDSGQMSLLLNNGEQLIKQDSFIDVNPFSETYDPDIVSTSPFLGDFNGDGELDVLIRVDLLTRDVSQWILHLNQGGGEFAPYGSDGIILTPFYSNGQNFSKQFRMKPLF